MTRALTGEGKTRLITRGDGIALTDMEKTKDCINTAHTHIKRIEELTEVKIALMKRMACRE